MIDDLIVISLVALPLAVLFRAVAHGARSRSTTWKEVSRGEFIDALLTGKRTRSTTLGIRNERFWVLDR